MALLFVTDSNLEFNVFLKVSVKCMNENASVSFCILLVFIAIYSTVVRGIARHRGSGFFLQNSKGLLYKTKKWMKWIKSSIVNKTCKCLILFVSDKAAFFVQLVNNSVPLYAKHYENNRDTFRCAPVLMKG